MNLGFDLDDEPDQSRRGQNDVDSARTSASMREEARGGLRRRPSTDEKKAKSRIRRQAGSDEHDYGQDGGQDNDFGYDSRCPACGDPIDYCQGHGESGDPAGHAILEKHDDGDHSDCHPDGCDDAGHEVDHKGSMRSEASILAAMADRSRTLPELQALAAELEDMRANRRTACLTASDIDLADAVIHDHLTPVLTHVRHSAATDWIGKVAGEFGSGSHPHDETDEEEESRLYEMDDDDPQDDRGFEKWQEENGEHVTDQVDGKEVVRKKKSSHEDAWATTGSLDNRVSTEASLWFGRISAEVKADREEFAEQAQGMARVVASAFGRRNEEARQTFLERVAFMHRRADSAVVVDPLPDSGTGPQAPDLDEWDTQDTTGTTGGRTAERHSTTCPKCSSSVDARVQGDKLYGKCSSCGWRGTKTKNSSKTAEVGPNKVKGWDIKDLADRDPLMPDASQSLDNTPSTDKDGKDEQSGYADSGLPVEPDADMEPFNGEDWEDVSAAVPSTRAPNVKGSKTAGSKAARDLKSGDKISAGTVSKVDTTTTPGVVYVYCNGKTDPPADATFNHGDPVTISDTTASKMAVSLSNVGIDSGSGNGVGTDPSGKRVQFRLSAEDKKALQGVLYSDLSVNFSGVDVEEGDIVSTSSKTAADYLVCDKCGDKIAKDPEGEDPSTWHHDNGDKHDHEATPKGGGSKESRRFIAGERHQLRLPHNEVCIHLGLAGQTVEGELGGDHAVQLYKDGKAFSFPITANEAGWGVSGFDQSAGSKTAAERTWPCQNCNATVTSWGHGADAECEKCGAQYNAWGQRLRDDWQGNPSNYDDDIGDMEGFEMQHSRDGSRHTAADHNDGSGAFRVEVTGVGENKWSGNGLSYDTEEEATRAGQSLISRWMGCDMMRVVPTATPKDQPLDPSDPQIKANWRKGSSKTAAGLNDVMEFDHVIRVHPDGSITDERGVYAPELMDGELQGSGWELLDGYSGQDRYSGPMMHASEFISGGMERDIRENPGVYVALVDYSAEGGDNDGWAVARKTGSRTTAADEREQAGQGESSLPETVDVGSENDRAPWPWEIGQVGENTGDSAADVANVPSPDQGYPQPKNSAALSRNCTNGNHSDCTGSSCSCPCHSRSEKSGACDDGDHGDCKMDGCPCSCHGKTSAADNSIFCKKCDGRGTKWAGGVVVNCKPCGGSGVKRTVLKKNPELKDVLPDYKGKLDTFRSTVQANLTKMAGRCPDCGHSSEVHRGRGCQEYPGDCGCPNKFGQ